MEKESYTIRRKSQLLLKEEDRSSVAEMFRLFDRNGEGHIKLSSLREHFCMFNFHLTMTEIRSLVQDETKGDVPLEIGFDDFALLAEKYLLHTDNNDHIKQAFQVSVLAAVECMFLCSPTNFDKSFFPSTIFEDCQSYGFEQLMRGQLSCFQRWIPMRFVILIF